MLLLVVTPGKVELEDTARDERIRRGSYKGELGKGRQTIAFDTKELDLCVPSVGQGYSHGMYLWASNLSFESSIRFLVHIL